MGNILNKLHIWYEKCMLHFHQEVVEPIPPIDGEFHADKIRKYGDILRDTKAPLENKGKAAHYIGLLAYTGGVSSGAPATEYIEDMINMLIRPDTSRKVRIEVLKGLCGVCYLHYNNQNIAKEHQLTDILLAFLNEEEDEESTDDEQDIIIMKFWVCYLMTVVCCNNLPYLKLFQDSGGQMLENRLESLSSMEWFGWPINYAEIMLSLMGYQKVPL